MDGAGTLPGYRVRSGGAWIDVRTARFLVGASPCAHLAIAGAARHLRLELAADGAIVRALDGPVSIRGVAVLAAPVPAAHVPLIVDAGGARIEIERTPPWTPPPAARPDLEAASPLRRLAIAAAASTGPLVVEGEPGTGRTHLARALHRVGPLVEVDAGGELDDIETRLFGAAMRRLGLDAGAGAFAEARGGTLLIDRIDELDPSLHTRLTTAIDRATDVRVVATARDLDVCDLSDALRDRVGVSRAWLPPLAMAPEDLFLFARRFADEVGLDAPPRDLPRMLGARPWRRNLAELRGFLARLRRDADD